MLPELPEHRCVVDRVPAAKGNRVTSVVRLRTFANASIASAVAFVDLQQEFPAGSHLPATADIGRVFDRCTDNAGLDGEVNETTDRIASTLSRKLGIGRNADG